MLPASLFPELATQPLHVQLMYGFVVGSGLLCLSVVAVGALLKLLRGRQPARQGELPPLPPAFPYAIDQIYTALFLLFILWGAVAGLMSPQPQEGETAFGWGMFLLGIAAQIGIYLPMLVRYGILHPMCRPTHSWGYYLGQPLLFWMLLCLTFSSLELSGFSSWLMRTTGCPEYQDIILIFRHGEPLQQLYIGICAVLIAPVAEECCFRGFLYTTLKRWGGFAAATLASAILFGAIHGSLAQMLPLTIFGIVQCYAYEKARSLWLPIAIHMLFNTTSLIATAVMLP